MVLRPIRDLPGHRRARAARLLSPASASSPLPAQRPPLLPGPLPHGRSSELGGIEEFELFRDPARSASICSRRSATSASSAVIRSACASIRAACSRISTSRGSAEGSSGDRSVTAPQSFLKPRTATTTTPRPPPKRNQRSLTAAVSRGPECSPAGPLRPSRSGWPAGSAPIGHVISQVASPPPAEVPAGPA
jgi:hypothetical protein